MVQGRKEIVFGGVELSATLMALGVHIPEGDLPLFLIVSVGLGMWAGTSPFLLCGRQVTLT